MRKAQWICMAPSQPGGDATPDRLASLGVRAWFHLPAPSSQPHPCPTPHSCTDPLVFLTRVVKLALGDLMQKAIPRGGGFPASCCLGLCCQVMFLISSALSHRHRERE
jgi:hypothetical protein